MFSHKAWGRSNARVTAQLANLFRGISGGARAQVFLCSAAADIHDECVGNIHLVTNNC